MSKKKTISVADHQLTITYLNKCNRRTWILCIILAVLLVLTNLGWFIYERQFEMVEETTEEYEVVQDNDSGDNNFNHIGRDGNITNG